jgi:hypothetical protein
VVEREPLQQIKGEIEMEIMKGRTLQYGQEVFVYFNLHKRCFSVKDVKTGLVIGHTDKIELEEATFKVSEAGRQRVLREQRKNVHAGVKGKYVGCPKFIDMKSPEATYNPYKYESFVNKATEEKLERASRVKLSNKKVFYVA